MALAIRFFFVFIFLVFGLMVASFIIMQVDQLWPASYIAIFFMMVGSVSVDFFFLSNFFFEFMLTLQAAAVLAADDVLEVVHAAKVVSPSNSEVWETKVVAPALILSDSVGLLSTGWGHGLTMAYVGLWGMGIGLFGLVLHFTRVEPVMAVFCSVGLLIVMALPMVMSQGVAAVSTSCDELGDVVNKRRIEDLDQSPRIHALELALKNQNNEQGLGFTLLDGSTVLDKKKLATLFFTVFSLFSTAIPLLLVFRESGSSVLAYGSFSDHPAVYMYSGVFRLREDSVTFCETMWMRPAIFLSLEQANKATAGLVPKGSSAFIGAERDTSVDPGPVSWDDGSHWWPADEVPVTDEGEPWMYLQQNMRGEIQWLDTTSQKGVLCMASSLSELKGAMPTILSLGTIGAEARRVMADNTCALSVAQAVAVQGVVESWTNAATCVYNMTLESIRGKNR
jgi:hypothetical protein